MTSPKKPKLPGVTPARAQSAQRELRVQEIVGLMTRNEWRTGASHLELSTRWGVTRKTVEEMAAEASRAIRRSMGDGEEMRSKLLASLEDIHHRALSTKDLRSAIQTVEATARILGLVVQKVEAKVSDLSKLSDDELAKKADELAERLRGGR